MLTTTRGLAAVTIPIAEEATEAQRAGGTGWGSNQAEVSESVLNGQGRRKKDAVQGGPGGVYLLPVAALPSDHKLGGFEQEHFILSQFRRPEVWKSGVSRAVLPSKALEDIPVLASLGFFVVWHCLARGCLLPSLPPSSHGLCPLGLGLLPLSLKRTLVISSRAHLHNPG